MTTDCGKEDNVARARLFRLALARGYAEYCRKARQPTRLQAYSRFLDKMAFYTGLPMLLMVFPLCSQPMWNEEFRAVVGPTVVWSFVALVICCMICATASFIFGFWQHCRDYRSSEEAWLRR